jgi:4-amino-4-deoxychorismate lyase
MWIFNTPFKILFFKDHIENLIKSAKVYGIKKNNLKKIIFKLLKENLSNSKNYNHLLRVALNKKVISISVRKKIKIKNNLGLKLVKLKRQKPEYKNLKYKEILSNLSKLDTSKTDIGLVSGKKLLETGTSNILLAKDKRIYSPIKGFYKGITFRSLEKKLPKIHKRNIFVNQLQEFDEIILIGSGKGVVSVSKIYENNWKRKSLNYFKLISKVLNSEIKKCKKNYYMRDPNNPCLFCNVKESGVAHENELAYASYDTYPVSDHHCLIIPKRHVDNYFELTNEELIACNDLIKLTKDEILDKDTSVKGFNIGTNSGTVAGQSIMHCHIHLIPRRTGDVDNPQGGVRSVIPKKQHYTRKK